MTSYAGSLTFILLAALTMGPLSRANIRTDAAMTTIDTCQEDFVDGHYLGEVKLPKIQTTKSGVPYFDFQSLDQALDFLETGHRATRMNPAARAPYLIPALSGFWEVLRRPDKDRIITFDRMIRLQGAFVMWINTISQLKTPAYNFEEQTLEDIYQIAIRVTGSELFRNFEHGITSANFSIIYGVLFRSPPQKQSEKWLDGLEKAISGEKDSNLSCTLRLPSLLKLTNSERVRVAKIWLKRALEIKSTDLSLENKGHALYDLFLIHPASAFTFFQRFKEDFLILDLAKPAQVIRPLAYFRYVLNREVPVFDIEYLAAHFDDKENHLSAGENLVGNWLADFGVHFQQNTLDPALPFIEMDFLITLENGRKVNVEVDGPHHFVRDIHGQAQQRLRDIRRDEILRANKIEVYRIPYFAFAQDRQESAKNSLMEFLIEMSESQ